MWFDDPLFADEWAARRGVGRPHFPPEYGARTWDIDAAALAELKAHASIDGTAQDDQIKQYCRAALDRLDGHAGELYQILQTRTVRQYFMRAQRVMPIIGPVVPSSVVTVEYCPSSPEAWETIDGNGHVVRNTAGGPEVILREAGFNEIEIEATEFVDPHVRVNYTAGMGANLSALPDDLRVAIYAIARQYYDYRDDTLPGMLSHLPAGVSATIARYRRNWDF